MPVRLPKSWIEWGKTTRGQATLAVLTLAPFVLIGVVAAVYPQDPLEEKPIRYRATLPTDAAARLQERMARGETKLRYDDQHGYLISLLRELNISPSSQTLVFSKTSVQHPMISPHHPRALYFGDEVYVGWVDGGAFLEITAMDPKLGAVFYVLEQRDDVPPRLMRRNDECLMCHSIPATGNVPGLLLRSIATRVDGTPNFAGGNFVITDSSPIAQRWGGWYVTGTHGTAKHRGNQVMREDEDTPVKPELAANVTDLKRFIYPPRYLTPHSDIVALMVMEHQATVQNAITKAGYESRRSLATGSKTLSPKAHAACDALLERLLFAGAASLPAPVKGTSTFAIEFEKRGPFDKQRRSLRQFDLKTRLMRYPCSYLIYSAEFNALPPAAKQYLYQRLGTILGGAKEEAFAHISPSDRTALRGILRDTKPDMASYLKTTISKQLSFSE